MGRRPIDRRSLKKRVLDAAERSIETRGLSGASMSELVRASGVSRRTFYKVFSSKEDVIKGLVDRKIEGALEHVPLIMGGGATTAEKVEALLAVVQRFTSFITPSLLREMAAAHPDLWEYIHTRRLRMLEVWRDILVAGQQRGEISKDVDPEIFMILLTTIAQHMINPTFLTEHGYTVPQMIGQVRAILLHGVLTPGERRDPARKATR